MFFSQVDDLLGLTHWSIWNKINIVVCFSPFSLSEVTFLIMASSLGDLGFAVQFKAERLWPFAQPRYAAVGKSQE